MIISCDLPSVVYDSHERMFGTSQTRRLASFVSKFVSEENYREVSTNMVSDGYVVRVFVRS